MRLVLVSVFTAGVAMSPVSAQGRSGVPAFTTPTWKSGQELDFPVSVRELRDGRVLLADLQTPAVHLLSARGALLRTVGRKGQGPGEYIEPRVLIAFPGDSTLVVDRSLRRFVMLSPSAGAVRTQALPDEIAQSANDVQGDALGTLVVPKNAFSRDATTPLVPLRRWRVGARLADSIAAIRPTATVKSIQKDKDGREVSFTTRAVWYSPQDDWAVAPDGAVAIVRVEPYRVEWLLPNGSRVAGPVQPAIRLPVTAAERADAGDLKLPETKPAFVAGYSLADPFGRVWVRHYGVEKSPVRRWSLFDRRGSFVQSLELPSTLTVLGLSARGVYVTRRDADDLQTLEFYAWR